MQLVYIYLVAAGFKKVMKYRNFKTHVATAHAVELTGAKAIIADVDYISGNLNLENIKKPQKTKGIILVHMAGIAKLDDIIKLSKKLKLTLIEDCVMV